MSRRLTRASLAVLTLAGLLLGFAASSQAVAAPGAWSGAGSLNDARSAHTVTRLPGGELLAAGGVRAGQPLGSAERYDPDARAWSSTGALSAARSSHTATRLPDGRVVVVGGDGADGDPLASTEVYDPATGSWSAGGALSTPRSSHTATLLGNGRILVAGGAGADGRQLESAEVYDPRAGTWSATGPLSAARASHTTTLLADGSVLVAGGTATDGGPLDSAELYDPGAGSWSTTGSLARARASHTATQLGDEVSGGADPRVLVAGGVGSDGGRLASAEQYDPDSGTWSATGALAAGRSSHTATLLPSGSILVAGGAGPGGDPLASAEVYDPLAESWSPTGALDGARSSHTATVLLSGEILVAGGAGPGGDSLASSERYEPVLGERWQATGSLGDARSGHTATLLPNGRVLVAGGHRTTLAVTPPRLIDPLTSAELYGPVSGTWTQTGGLARGRSFHTAIVLRGSPSQCGTNCGKVLVAGGIGADDTGRAGTLDSAELYDPATGSWSATGSLRTARALHTATLLPNGKVLVVAGAGPGGAEPRNANQLASAELYDPVSGTWAETGALDGSTSPPASNTPRGARFGHTASLLDRAPCGGNCGKVLVAAGVGGVGTGPALSSAELYDPSTGTFTPTRDLSQRRQSQAAALLPNGEVLVTGGIGSPSTGPPNLDAGDVYDPVTQSWAPSGLLTARRIAHTATLMSDGDVLLAGGAAGGNAPGAVNVPGPALLSSERYESTVNRFVRTSFLNVGRVYHTATPLPAGPPAVCGDNCGKVLVVGGDRELIGTFAPYFNLLSPLRSAELYVPPSAPGPSPTPTPTPTPTPGGDGDGGDAGVARLLPRLVRPGFARAVQRGGRRGRAGSALARVSQARRGRIVVRLRGRMIGNGGRRCGGRLKIGTRAGGRRVRTKTARMGRNCRYSKRYTFAARRLPKRLRPRGRKLVLRIAVRYQGNSLLRGDLSPTKRVKVRR